MTTRRLFSTAACLKRANRGWTRTTITRPLIGDAQPSDPAQMDGEQPTTGKDYSAYSSEELIRRVNHLELLLRRKNQKHTPKQAQSVSTGVTSSSALAKPGKKQNEKREFDPSKYSTRYIALRLAYLGQRYNGFEHHVGNQTPLPTIEEELWKALAKTRLIFPDNGTDGDVDWEGCEYSKCGRTDKGVSAFGQVIALKVRSSKPLNEYQEVVIGRDEDGEAITERRKVEWDPVKDELAYPRLLNRILPDDIRILAWCPAPSSEFSARFSCKERRYRYFFTQPAFVPRPGPPGMNNRGQRDGWLDVTAMQIAARYFEGLHDFRNFCKIDPSKQIQSFERRVFVADIRPATSSTSMPQMTGWPEFGPKTHSGSRDVEKEPTVLEFRVSGSGFLWHQVRCMAAILFLVGQGLERPEIVKDMLDIQNEPQKPQYDMADDAPLVLWDCIFPREGAEGGDLHRDGLDWILPEDQIDQDKAASSADGRYGPGGVNVSIWSQWRNRKIEEVLAGSLLDVVAASPRDRSDYLTQPAMRKIDRPDAYSNLVFLGRDHGNIKGVYQPLLQRKRNLPVEEQNSRYLVRKGISPDQVGSVSPDAIDD